jgi:hypothetical protein
MTTGGGQGSNTVVTAGLVHLSPPQEQVQQQQQQQQKQQGQEQRSES